VFAGLLLAGAAARSEAQAGAPALAVRVARFYQPDFQQTVVKTLVQFPVTGLSVAGTGSQAQLSYRIAVQVTDSNGLKLMDQSWRGHVPAAFQDDPRVTVPEMFEFSVKPGRYRLTVSVEDSVTGRALTRSVPLDGFATAPSASDLVLSSGMRVADAGDSVPKAGEWRRGSTVVREAADVALDPIHEDRASLYYLLEAYTRPGQTGDSGTLSVRVTDTAGHVMVQTPPAAVRLGAGGGILRGQLPLMGLPEGSYTATATLTLHGSAVERSAGFRMASLQAALEQEAADRKAATVSDSGFFSAMGDDSLDEAFAPLDYIAKPEDQMGVWKRGLSTAAKRQFLIQFWDRRDPTPGTPRNEARDQFYGLIALANQKFTERGQGARPGWRSDRGRIYIKNGEPVERLQRQNIGTAPPYEVWRYASGRDRWYIFVDVSGFGAFQLVATNDLHEPTKPDWQSMLGTVALQDVGQFLNQNFEPSTQQ
jgi:GWxTD domain-containing protein